MDKRTKVILFTFVALVPASFCGCCCFTGMFGSHQAQVDQQAVIDARNACTSPSTFRLRGGGLSTRPADWECLTPDQIAAEQAAAAAEAARMAAAQAAQAEAERAQIEAARTACIAPSVFRSAPGADPSRSSSWACVTADQLAAEQAQADREAAAAEAARIAALPMEVTACQVQNAYQANEIAADHQYPQGRRMIVTGRVDHVAQTFGTMIIYPRTCMFTMVNLADDQAAVAAQLQRGDSFRADCTMGNFVMAVAFDECRLIR